MARGGKKEAYCDVNEMSSPKTRVDNEKRELRVDQAYTYTG